MCQWANSLGATVIGTVSTKEKEAQAKEDGCHHVIIYKEEDFVARVNEITSENGVNVVYDSVGKDTFQVIIVLFILYLSTIAQTISCCDMQGNASLLTSECFSNF